MKRIFTIIACVGATLALGCTGESALPEPTGKGLIRAINGIPGSPAIAFRIEERPIEDVLYKNSSRPARYDDFEYNFNFDISVPGQTDQERIATIATKIEADRDHVFVLTGDLDNPTISTWVSDERSWAESDTVFEARFAHLATSLGSVDIYLYEDTGPAPVQGEQAATLSYGEVMDYADFANGTYRALITAAGDITAVYHHSRAQSFTEQTSHHISLFDSDENDTSPYILFSMSAEGQALRLTDPSSPGTIRFVHSARTLQAVDVYRDDLLTDLVAADLALGESQGDFEASTEEATWYFTPAGSTATILFSPIVPPPPPSARTSLHLVGDTDAWSGVDITQDRASTSNLAKLSLFHGAVNGSAVDLYVVDRDDEIPETASPIFRGLTYSFASGIAFLPAGSFDVYLTEAFEKDVVAGPFPLETALGDVIFLHAIDDVNPGSFEIQDVSVP
jgi:hypothetical protein